MAWPPLPVSFPEYYLLFNYITTCMVRLNNQGTSMYNTI